MSKKKKERKKKAPTLLLGQAFLSFAVLLSILINSFTIFEN